MKAATATNCTRMTSHIAKQNAAPMMMIRRAIVASYRNHSGSAGGVGEDLRGASVCDMWASLSRRSCSRSSGQARQPWLDGSEPRCERMGQ